MTVYCYPAPGKAKARLICQSFAEGCGGTVIDDGKFRDGQSMFYGIAPGMESLWRSIQDSGQDWYSADNSYFDSSREKFFRVTKNRLQHLGFGKSDSERFDALGIKINPWRSRGGYLLLCPQSEHFMRSVAGYNGNWTSDTMRLLTKERPVLVRSWGRDKAAQAASLKADLAGAHAVLTWSSAAAITAVLEGLPAVCSPHSAARRVSVEIPELDSPPRPVREQWAGVLADNQWTLAEMRDGTAWRALNG